MIGEIKTLMSKSLRITDMALMSIPMGLFIAPFLIASLKKAMNTRSANAKYYRRKGKNCNLGSFFDKKT